MNLPEYSFRIVIPQLVLAAMAWAFLLLLGYGQVWAAEAQPLHSQKNAWRLMPQYSDEFNGAKLDTVKWDNDVQDWGVWSWEPGNVWVNNGNLNVRMEYSQHRRGQWTLYYKSGVIKSRAAPIRYGYFEARIKAASRFPGAAPAFWAYRDEGSEWTEIDFVELTQRRLDPTLVDTNLQVVRQPSFPHALPHVETRSWKAPWDPRDEFHVYGCEWDEREIRWYIDGRLIQARSNEYWHQALDVLISFGVRAELKKVATPDGFPTTFQVDYVRVWSASK